MKILVVEDDRAVAQALQLLLSSYNYAVDIAADGEAALQMADAFEYHLVLLDVLLPRLSGVEVCRQLRKKGFQQPILLLTGQGATQQKAIALNAGADDYVVKPFDNDELVARIQALLRRGATVSEPVLTWGQLLLDPNTRRVAYRDQLLALTPKEFAILELFLRHQETVFSARAILDQAWSSVESPGEEVVRCHIKDLRQKLTAVSAPKDLIKTVHRVGYRLNPLYASAAPQVNPSSSATQIAELRSVNEELRVAMEQLQSTQDELQQKNQELQSVRDELEQRVSERTAELSQREAFLSSIYEGVEQSVFVVDVTETSDFRYLSFNRSALQSTGLSLQEIQNKTPEEVFGLAVGSLFRQNYERCVQSDSSIVCEDHFTYHDRPIWTLTTLSPLRNPQGRIDRIVGTVLDVSGRKQAEIALHQSEAQMSRILDNAGAAIGELLFYADRPCVHRFHSVGCEMVFGYSQFEMMEDPGLWLSRVLPEDVETVVMPSYKQVFAGNSFTIEYRFQDKTDTIRWISETLTSRWNEADSGWLLTTIAIDISDRKRAEAALQSSEEQRRLALDLTSTATWDWNLATDKIIWSENMFPLFGLVPGSVEPTYGLWQQCVHPDDIKHILLLVQTHLQHQTLYQAEYRVVHPDGSIHWVLSKGHGVYDATGQAVRMIGITIDISDRRQAEAKLRESEQKYRSLFESIDQGFCLLEVLFDANDKAIDYRFMEINEAFEQQSGLANAVGKTILELVPNLEPQWAELYGQVAKTGESVRFEADVPSMNRIFDIYAFPSGAPGQNLVAVLFTDITERKRTEEILRRTAALNAFRVSLADALRPLTDASEIQAIAARLLGEALQATRVIYIEVVSEGEEVIVHRNYTNGVAELSGRYCLEDYRRNLTVDHPDGRPQVVTDIPSNPNYTDAEKARYRELDIAAHIDVPLLKNNQFVALLAVHQSTPRQWTETEIKLVEETAERTWAAAERAYTEATLHQNEEMLRLALTGAKAGSWDWELATGHLTWSPETYQLFGLDPNTPLPLYDAWYNTCLHPDDRLWASNYVNQVITQRQSDLQLEFRILHPQLGVRWILCLGHLTVNKQGEPVRLSGIDLDISDRKQSEEQLQLSQAKFEALVTNMPGMVYRYFPATPDKPHHFSFVSPQAIDLFELAPETLVQDANALIALIHPDDLLSFSNSVTHSVEHFLPWRWQGRIITPSGQLKWIQGNAQAQQTPEGEAWDGLLVDISDRQQAEQKIREQAALLDISTDAILVCDLDCRILYWNQGAESLYGWQAEEVLGQKANELLSRIPSTFVELKHTVLERGAWHGEIQRVTKTGKAVTVEGRCTLVQDEMGQPKSILSVDTDITEKKNLEAQFYQAQRLESLGTLAGGIAHDLNNALTPILTIAQLLRMQKTKLDARSQEMLQILEDSAKRATNMVQQILTFTRGTGGEKTSVDVALLLQEAVSVIQQTFPKSITIHTEIPAQGVRQVSADATQLHQVLINLCVNARDAMPNGGTLTLSAENFDANEVFVQMNLDAHVGQYVLITVTDTGTGIAPDVRDRIFDPFFTTKAIGQGTGLGLSTVLGIIRSYDGFIQVVSEVGNYTQFKVYLPAIETETAPNLQQTTLPQGQGELILVVDDEDRILQSTLAILEAHHYQVLTARSGAEAIATYAQHQQEIAVVLIDMMMPDMDGIMLIQVLQEMNPQVQAIAVSGLLPQYQNSLKALGITTHLNKPYTTEDLLNSIHLQL